MGVSRAWVGFEGERNSSITNEGERNFSTSPTAEDLEAVSVDPNSPFEKRFATKFSISSVLMK